MQSHPLGFIRRISLPLGALVLGLSCAGLSAQTIIVKDTFTLNTTDREAGDTLNKTTPDISDLSGATWKVNGATTSALVFANTGGVTNGLTSAAEGRIAISTPAASITVQTDIKTGTSAQWAATGLLSSATTANWTKASGADSVLWMLIKPNGAWEAYANGTSTKLGSGTVSGFSSSSMYTLGLTYDPVANTASSFLTSSDGTTITLLADTNVASLVSASSIVAAGFRVNGSSLVADSVLFDNFLVTTTAIPEPQSVSMILGSSILLSSIFGRRAQR